MVRDGSAIRGSVEVFGDVNGESWLFAEEFSGLLEGDKLYWR